MLFVKASSKVILVAALLAVGACGEIRSHSDFETLVKDKSATEVERKLGKPAAVEDNGATVRWTYTGKTFTTDNEGTHFDKKAVVVFRKADSDAPAKVAEVVYEK